MVLNEINERVKSITAPKSIINPYIIDEKHCITSVNKTANKNLFFRL